MEKYAHSSIAIILFLTANDFACDGEIDFKDKWEDAHLFPDIKVYVSKDDTRSYDGYHVIELESGKVLSKEDDTSLMRMDLLSEDINSITGVL